MGVSAEVSIYPLGQNDLGPAIDAALQALEAHGVDYEAGRMSTVLEGDEREVFAALRDAFLAASAHGGTVMAVTVSNCCPAARPK
jgi:uncharacterized protein YqgV (UPF0045/DUF77 family)